MFQHNYIKHLPLNAITQRTNILKVFLFIIYISINTSCISKVITYNSLDEEKIKYELKQTQQSPCNNNDQKNIIKFLESALHFINEKKSSEKNIKEYQYIIDNFPNTIQQLKKKYDHTTNNYSKIKTDINLPVYELKKELEKINKKIVNLSKQLQQEEDQIRSIQESLKLLPQQKTIIKNKLHYLKQQQQIFVNNIIKNTPLEHAKFTAFQAERASNRLKMIELELYQLSSNNRKKLSILKIKLLKKQYNHTYNLLQILRTKINCINHKKTNQIFDSDQDNLLKKYTLPKCIKNQLEINHNISSIITTQIHYIDDINLKKQEIETHISQVNQVFSNLIEQAQWINKSPSIGETLRSQVSKLPKIPKLQQLDNELAQLKAKKLKYENQIHNISNIILQSRQDNGSILTDNQKNILETQLHIQHNLITSLLNNYDIQILELTQLKLLQEQLKDTLQEVQQATHRYLFWVANIKPITITYPINVYQDIKTLLTNNVFRDQIQSSLYIMCTNHHSLMLIIFSTFISVILYFIMHYHYHESLKHTYKYIGKVNKDNFLITFYNICNSIFIALPIPILWFTIGYELNHMWQFPIAIAVGDSMNTTVFILWGFIISGYLASSKGLFIMHFGWSKNKVNQVFSKNYPWSVAIIMLLTTSLTIFNNYNNQEFSSTLGRLCFFILCLYLIYITNNLKKSGLPLYLNKHDSSNNVINQFLWNTMILAPILAAISCAFGYLFTAQTLLIKLETSLFIWIISLIIYHIIRRWMLIQRRRIAFERAKKKRAIQLISRIHNESHLSQDLLKKTQSISNNNENKRSLDLDTISTQSLQLTRSIITLIALLLITLIWSKLRFAFSFLENITLWDINTTIKGIENIQPITLNAFLTVIVVIIITTITVRNLPSFLELTLLQYLNLTPGTGYAITTLTKYILLLIGGLIGCSLIGIEWLKIQWLIAALGVGLGFGLQEIFANFISGLMILFEKPIRIGDTITIRNLTGNVTRINTRATIITDWDHKEIIVPNKEFITKQFTNWSLSDTITRVILRIPTPLEIDEKKMIHILSKIIKNSTLALHTPSPEIYLINLQYGLPIFELRIYTSEIKSRIPLLHQINMGIIEYYKIQNLKLPTLPFIYFYKESAVNNTSYEPINNLYSFKSIH